MSQKKSFNLTVQLDGQGNEYQNNLVDPLDLGNRSYQCALTNIIFPAFKNEPESGPELDEEKETYIMMNPFLFRPPKRYRDTPQATNETYRMFPPKGAVPTYNFDHDFPTHCFDPVSAMKNKGNRLADYWNVGVGMSFFSDSLSSGHTVDTDFTIKVNTWISLFEIKRQILQKCEEIYGSMVHDFCKPRWIINKELNEIELVWQAFVINPRDGSFSCHFVLDIDGHAAKPIVNEGWNCDPDHDAGSPASWTSTLIDRGPGVVEYKFKLESKFFLFHFGSPRDRSQQAVNDNRTVNVYCNAIKPSMLGDVEAPVLRTLPPFIASREGFKSFSPEQPFYHDVSQKRIPQITLRLVDDTGEDVSLHGKTALVTLNFKQTDQL